MLPSVRLVELGLTLPPVPAAKGSYAPAVNDGYRVYVSGQVVTEGGSAVAPGLVGREVDPARARALVRVATLQGLAAAASVAGGVVDQLRRAIRVGVFIASADGFDRQHEVAEGATELLNELFGPENKPARVTVGVARLPLNVPVEVELLFELVESMDPTGLTGVFRHGRDLYTRNAEPGRRVYGEDLRTESGVEYRRIRYPFRSKLAAYLLNAPNERPWSEARSVLYLGGAHGTTVSHLSDALPDAEIFVVEKSPMAFAPLLALSRRRSNLWPILSDAQLPERYAADVGRVDLLYQDVAQRTQAEIFAENARVTLAPSGRGLLMLKVRSVTQRRTAARVISDARETLTRAGWTVRTPVDLRPFSREHAALALR